MSERILAPLLKGLTLAGDGLVIAEWTDEGGTHDPPLLIAPPHIHLEDDEAWYVLEGTLCVRQGEEVHEVRAGACVLVPKGTPHTYWNPGPEPARYLLIMPKRIHELIQAIHSAPVRTREVLDEMFAAHQAQLL